MKKKFTFLMAAIMLLTTMVLPGKAVGQTRTNFVINTTNFTKTATGTGYAAYNGEHEIDGITIVSNQVMPATGTDTGKLQFQTNKGCLYNTDEMPGNITKITLSTTTNFTIYVGTSEQPSTTSVSSGATISGSYTYFQIKGGSSTPKTASITVEYTPTHTITYSATNGSISGVVYGTSTAIASGASVAEGGKVALTANPAPGYLFTSWDYSPTGTGAPTLVADGNTATFTMGTADATVTANFEASASNYIYVSPSTANPTAASQNVVFEVNTNQELFASDVRFYTAATSGSETEQPDWIKTIVYNGSSSPKTLTVTVSENTSVARSAYFTLKNATVESSVITINQAAPYFITGNEFSLYSGNLVEGDYIIYYEGYAMKNTVNDGGRLSYEEVTPTSNVITTTDNTIIWHIAPSDDYWTIYNANAEKYAASTGVKNKAQMLADGTDDKALWTVDGTTTYEFENKANAAAGVNANLRNNGTYGFACYATSTGGALSLYKKNSVSINGYGNNPEVETGWCLIASPVTVTLESTPMVTGTYDLYRFNPTVEMEWENYKNTDHSDFTTLEVGRGYLYANANDITLNFTGTYAGDGEVTVPNAGWNLIGNPLITQATITNPYYRINGDNTGIMAGEGKIAVMEGIFVQTATADETVTFTAANSKEDNSINNALVINLNRNDKVIDRAIARLNSDRKLSKLTLFDDDTKIYIPQNGVDYAIAAMDDNTQAFSLNFHAKTTGKYTLSLGETSNFGYVHIFDRMTGEDVDMLLDDSYSFIGSPADSEERFIIRLSYNASSTDSETFAYQSGNEIIVNGEGTLEVYDVTGRKVMTTTINGVETINGLNNGVYVFRVIGETLRTQKIVVR